MPNDSDNSAFAITGAAVILGIGFLLTLLGTLAVRMLNGASIKQLVASRFHEIPPARALLHWIHVLAWGLTAAFGAVAVLSVFTSFQPESPRVRLWIQAAVAAGLCFACRRAVRWWVAKAIRAVDNSPPPVDIRAVRFESSLPTEALSTLGCERFPSAVSPWYAAGLLARFVVLVNTLVAGAAMVAAAAADDPKCPLSLELIALARHASGLIETRSTLMSSVFGVLLVGAGTLAAIVLRTNRSYLLVRFPVAISVVAVCIAGAMAAVAGLGGGSARVLGVGGLLSLWLSWRMLSDLRAARRYARQKRVVDAITGSLAPAGRVLAKLPRTYEAALPELTERDIRSRLRDGARNVESASSFVVRNFARFMTAVAVRRQTVYVAAARFLTVRRYLSYVNCGGTYLSLRHPHPPVWDEKLFPLNVPGGFVNWIDPLSLGTAWDIVCICGRCGGSGRVTETEYYTEYETRYENGQSRQVAVQKSRQVEKTCPSCSGAGRILQQQVLNTQWQRLLPALTEPFMPMPELVEDADEADLFRICAVEDRQDIPLEARTLLAGQTAAELAMAMTPVARAMRHHGKEVERLHDGRLFRADVGVAAFWAINIDFERLRGRTGWFFGKRPEFYFPILPISWSYLLTCITFPLPAAILAAIWAVTLYAAATSLVGIR
ncbi:MAG: hypothetical protein ACOYN0_07090 [Phycisphaerales bacterium]